MAARFCRALHSKYIQVSFQKPYITASLTAGGILTFADGTAQYLSTRFVDNYTYDWRRTIALGTFGFFYYGFVARKIYFLYERYLGPGRPVLKAFMDCTAHTYIVLIPSFYLHTGLIKGNNLRDIATQLRTEYWMSASGTCVYWFPLMMFNFKYCSPETRIFFIAIGSFIHKTALSWYSNRLRLRERLLKQSQLETDIGTHDHELQL